MDLVLLKREHLRAFDLPPALVGQAEAFVQDGQVLAVVCFLDFGSYAEVCLELSDKARAMPVAVHRTALRFLSDLHLIWDQPRYRSLRYLTARVKRDDLRARRWVERLGFQEDGRLEGNMARFVRTA